MDENYDDNLVRFYGIVPGLDAADIELFGIEGGRPAIVDDADEGAAIGAEDGDLVLAWGPAGGFPVGTYAGEGEGEYGHEGGRTTDFMARISASGMYEVTFVAYDWTEGEQINEEGQTANIMIWEARVSGGGQMLAESGDLHRNGRDINYRISFGGGSYIVNGEYWFDGLEVTFHHVSNEDVMGGKFVGTSLLDMDFNFATDGVANYQVQGDFNGEPGYRMIIRVQDSGEPGSEDNLRFELWDGSGKVYDSFDSGDFPGESSDHGTARNYLDRGNIQVQDLR